MYELAIDAIAIAREIAKQNLQRAQRDKDAEAIARLTAAVASYDAASALLKGSRPDSRP